MPSLYIKDVEAGALAEQLAAERGLTKTAAVKLALANELSRVPRRSARERMEEYWKRYPLPDELGPALDKAFWDDVSGGL